MTSDWRQTRLDHAITAIVLALFATAWFGWAHAGGPSPVGVWLDAASGVAGIVAVAAVVTAFRVPRERAVATTRAERRRYGIIVGIEFTLIGLGGAALNLAGGQRWVPVWVLAVVAVHFFPLAPVLANRALYPLGALLFLVASAALVGGLVSTVDPAGVAGIGGGVGLTAWAACDLGLALRRQPDAGRYRLRTRSSSATDQDWNGQPVAP